MNRLSDEVKSIVKRIVERYDSMKLRVVRSHHCAVIANRFVGILAEVADGF